MKLGQRPDTSTCKVPALEWQTANNSKTATTHDNVCNAFQNLMKLNNLQNNGVPPSTLVSYPAIYHIILALWKQWLAIFSLSILPVFFPANLSHATSTDNSRCRGDGIAFLIARRQFCSTVTAFSKGPVLYCDISMISVSHKHCAAQTLVGRRLELLTANKTRHQSLGEHVCTSQWLRSCRVRSISGSKSSNAQNLKIMFKPWQSLPETGDDQKVFACFFGPVIDSAAASSELTTSLYRPPELHLNTQLFRITSCHGFQTVTG